MCEDYPCCGHTEGDPCAPQWYDAPGAFDTSVNPHALCDHENGECNVDEWGDEWGCVDPEDCDHGDTSFNEVERDGVMVMVNRHCDRCYTDLPDAPVPAEWL